MNIYDLLNEMTGETYAKPEDIRAEVELALGDQFENGASQLDEVKAKFKTYRKFVNEVIKVLTDGTVKFDDSWGNGEVYMNIENIGQDILDGNPIGSRQNYLAELVGTNDAGTMNRLFGSLF